MNDALKMPASNTARVPRYGAPITFVCGSTQIGCPTGPSSEIAALIVPCVGGVATMRVVAGFMRTICVRSLKSSFLL